MKSFIILFFTIIVLINPKLVTSYSRRRCQRRNLEGGAPFCPIVKCQPKGCGNKLCTDLEKCSYGRDPNDCSCCPSCLKEFTVVQWIKGPGEACGGILNVAGNCIKGHQCLADVDGIEKCVKCRCELVKCGGPEFLGCRYGSEPDPVCGCCPVCLKGPGEECGPAGNCARGLVCKESLTTFGKGKCVGKNCPNCAVTLCLAPESLNCKFGVEIDPVCGCCHVCLKGPRESCGGIFNSKGNCGEGLVCKSGRHSSKGGICSYPKLTTPPPDECPNCAATLCLSADALGCKYGSTIDSVCGCCPVCLLGPGQCCGGEDCVEGFYCADSNDQPISRNDSTGAIGRCRSNSCPDCNLVDCIPVDRMNCENGTKLDPFCRCCQVCKKGLGETCGGHSSNKGACEEGLKCENPPGSPVFQAGPDPPEGTCNKIGIYNASDDCPKLTTPPPDECPNCAATLCLSADGLGCKYGSTIDPVCGCCPVCLLGPGDSCGGFRPLPIVDCGTGLRCHIENVTTLPDATGICVPID